MLSKLIYASRKRPKILKVVEVDKENISPLPKRPLVRLHSLPQQADRLSRPFSCPGAAGIASTREGPKRKRRKISYADADASVEDGDRPWTQDERKALSNKYPVFRVKNKDEAFRQQFSVPMLDKNNLSRSRSVPTLGMRQGTVFVAKPLHDPSGEFAIVLFDPTVDDKPLIEETKEVEQEKPKIKVSLMHKSLSEILGIEKQVKTEHPRVPVVIDPRLSKVLRPHQIEGVKVCSVQISINVEKKISNWMI